VTPEGVRDMLSRGLVSVEDSVAVGAAVSSGLGVSVGVAVSSGIGVPVGATVSVCVGVSVAVGVSVGGTDVLVGGTLLGLITVKLSKVLGVLVLAYPYSPTLPGALRDVSVVVKPHVLGSGAASGHTLMAMVVPWTRNRIQYKLPTLGVNDNAVTELAAPASFL
jgi:hypothetical protein